MARIWGSIRRAVVITGAALLCVLAYYALLYLVSPHPPHVDYPTPGDLPPGALVAEGGYVVTAYNMSPSEVQLDSGPAATRDTGNLSYAADSGITVISGYDANLSEGREYVDTSGSDGLVSFFDLPLWIQLRYLPIALFGGLATFFGTLSVVRRRKENLHKGDVLTFIKENPGCTAPEVSRGRNLNIGTVRYYIKKLEDEGRIVLAKIGKFSRDRKSVV